MVIQCRPGTDQETFGPSSLLFLIRMNPRNPSKGFLGVGHEFGGQHLGGGGAKLVSGCQEMKDRPLQIAVRQRRLRSLLMTPGVCEGGSKVKGKLSTQEFIDPAEGPIQFPDGRGKVSILQA